MMRALTTRESMLALVAGGVLLVAISWVVADHIYSEWNGVHNERIDLERRRVEARGVLEREAPAKSRLEALRSRLPNHPPQQNVTADILRTVEMLAGQNSLLLTRRIAEPERTGDGLHEVSIACDWEGSLESLVRFLYAVQTHDAMLDVQRLTIRPITGQAGRLRGTVTVDAAFTREEPVDARP